VIRTNAARDLHHLHGFVTARRCRAIADVSLAERPVLVGLIPQAVMLGVITLMDA
jgi:hypothetical protein